MSRTYEFVQLDVFTHTPLTGNPLAIFSDARGLTDEEMQALAREMNLSETTFIFPREPQVEAREGKRVRIFTVEEELPFAGHPTLGTALHLRNIAGSQADEIVLDLNVGKIGVRFSADSGRIRTDASERVAGDVFGEMRQRDPDFGPILPRDQIASVVNDGAHMVAADWPSQIVSTGLPFAIVPIRDAKALTNLKPDLARARAVLEGTDAKFCYFISPEREGWHQVRARMFFYGGEDPATGSAAGCAMSWMARYGLAKSDEKILIYQGIEAGRPSQIFVRATREGEKVTNVRVGGFAVEVLRGTLNLNEA
jgi:trans-2,3-dihydro-3-hydroxyanthranilate isomerase